MTQQLSQQAQFDILNYLARHYPSPTGIPATFGEQIDTAFRTTLETLKGNGFVEYTIDESRLEPSPLPSVVTLTSAGLEFVRSQPWPGD